MKQRGGSGECSGSGRGSGRGESDHHVGLR